MWQLLVLPYYIQSTLHQSTLLSARMAVVAFNLSGITNGILYMFLRANVDETAFRSVNTIWRDKSNLIMFGTRDQTSTFSMQQKPTEFLERQSSQKGQAVDGQTTDVPRCSTDLVSPLFDVHPRGHAQPTKARISPSRKLTIPPRSDSLRKKGQHKAKYSLYPAAAQEMSPVAPPRRLRSSAESSLRPPSPLFSHRHRRVFSSQTSASVPIGLRLSLFRASYAGTGSPTLSLHHRQSSLQSTLVPPSFSHPDCRRSSPSKFSERSMDISIAYAASLHRESEAWNHEIGCSGRIVGGCSEMGR